MADAGRLLPRGGVREGHRACQLAEDVEDATAEAYNAWNLLNKAGAFVSDDVRSAARGGMQRWWLEKRLPKWAAHFEKALQAAGGHFSLGQQPTYGQSHARTLLASVRSAVQC